jgi:Cdc6-like AAA superfamily ATPase
MTEGEERGDVEGLRWHVLAIEAGKAFTPTSPIDERSLFSGRDEQVRLLIDVINQKGQHAVLYGERGVGKTSLANVMSSFLGNPAGTIVAPRVNCDAADTFDSVWRKVFEHLEESRNAHPVGFRSKPEKHRPPIAVADDRLTPESVRRFLVTLAQSALPIVIIDEFDRLGEQPRRAFADLIKTLSDHAVGATVVLVGVADSVEQLIEEHASVERALVQIRMPRMSVKEIRSVLDNGASRLGMVFDGPARSRIEMLAQGLPHYAHLVGLHAVRAALDDHTLTVTLDAVSSAVARAVGGTQQSVLSVYDIAIRSARKDNLFSDVLLACALAETSELGYFAAQDVREPLRKITGKPYEITSFAQHLNEFCDKKRGPVLHKDGVPRLYRYRFINPLLQPFIVMRGLNSGRIEAAALG